MFTELCMNKSTHNQFRTRIVTRVTRVSILVKVVFTSYFPCFSIHVNLLPQKCWRNLQEKLAKKRENFVGLRYVKNVGK